MMPMKKGFEPVRSSLYRNAKEEAYMPGGVFSGGHALARDAINEAAVRGDDVFPNRDPGFLEDFAMRMTKMRAEAEELAARLEIMADRVFGPEPEDAAHTGPAPPADCNVAQLVGLASGVGGAMSRASYAMGRLERL